MTTRKPGTTEPIKELRIADNLSLPLDSVTQSLAILARKRAGKSYLARGIAEHFLQADQQVVIIDPKGDWWGIRSSSDGKSPGFPVVVLSGEHGDLPLEKTADTIARLIVEEQVSVLLDLSDFRKSDVALFLGGAPRQRAEGLLELIYRFQGEGGVPDSGHAHRRRGGRDRAAETVSR